MPIKTFTLKELKVRLDDTPFEKQGTRAVKRKMYPKELKQDILSFHYSSGRTIPSICIELGLADQVLNKWKRQLGTQRTGAIHGKTVRNDIRTKALAVKDYTEGLESSKVAVKYGVTQSTIYMWINRYQDKYTEYLDLSDGVMIIAKEEKQVFGDKNIAEVEQMLKDQNQALTTLLQNQHYTKAELTTLNNIKTKASKKQLELNTLKDTAKKLHIKL